ncbi:MAG: formate dehydrogenase accessory sulfurtransferase FdhD [Pseudomonadota bacterium]|nr:formate dehydrogenase accessory sulfurtransferase FdhD [Pseudomonadota bacterium]
MSTVMACDPTAEWLSAARQGVARSSVCAWRGGEFHEADDSLAEETPVALVFNGISHAVMLATPLDLEDFALGFALSDGILESVNELYGVDTVVTDLGIELQLEVASACLQRLKARRRTLAGRTGCGLCGTESLAQLTRAWPTPAGKLRITPAAVASALSALHAGQTLQHLTGSLHAAAWCDADGRGLLVREDVGRHNALDKLVGALAAQQVDPGSGFIAVTSRASVEMVQKALTAGVDILVAVSAPTALAVEQARRGGLGLAGFARGERFVCYAYAERFGRSVPQQEKERATPAAR